MFFEWEKISPLFYDHLFQISVGDIIYCIINVILYSLLPYVATDSCYIIYFNIIIMNTVLKNTPDFFNQLFLTYFTVKYVNVILVSSEIFMFF